MNTFARVAYIASTRNLNGSVVCKAADTLPFLLAAGQHVHFVPPTLHGPRQARVLSVEEYRSGLWEVAFEGVETIDVAKALVGSYCLIAEEELTLSHAAERSYALQGFSVEDATFGLLGTVVRVQENPAQTLLEIEGARGLVLVPFVDEFVANIDDVAQVIFTTLSESLLALNAHTEGQD